MKKLFVATIILCISTACVAQNSFRFGLQGTGGLSWFAPDTKGIENDGVRLNYNFGLMTDFAIGEGTNYYFATGLNIATLNGKLKYNDLVYTTPNDSSIFFQGSSSSKYNLNYLEIPLTLKMRTNEVGYMHYFGIFGVTPGINTRARMELEQSTSSGTFQPDDELDVADEIRLFKMDLNIGFGVEYNFTGNTFAIASLTYNNGFTNIFNDEYYELDAATDEVVLADSPTIDDGSGNQIPYTAQKGPDWKAQARNIRLTVGIFF